MSMKELMTVSCPECGQGQEVLVWSSLNVQVSPESKPDFFAGRINLLQCQSCGGQTRLVTPFVYHDMILKLYVQYYPTEILNDDNALAGFEPDGSVDPNAVSTLPEETQEAMRYFLHPHVVFSMQEALNYVVFREALAEFHETRSQ